MGIKKGYINPLEIKDGDIFTLNNKGYLICGLIHPGHREVKLVKELDSGRQMVLKLNVEPEEVERMELFSCPNIVRGGGVTDSMGNLALLMEYIEGPDFYDYLIECGKEPLGNIIFKALEIIETVGETLIYLMEKDIQLGEFFSKHILIEKKSQRPILIDFHHTHPVSDKMMPYYMKQLETLLRLIIGRVNFLFDGFSVIEPTNRKEDVPPELDDIISKCSGTKTPVYQDLMMFVNDVNKVKCLYA